MSSFDTTFLFDMGLEVRAICKIEADQAASSCTYSYTPETSRKAATIGTRRQGFVQRMHGVPTLVACPVRYLEVYSVYNGHNVLL